MILEVLDPRTGEVRTWTRLNALPLTLGRGYDNDLVLDDPYVDAHHARVTLDGADGIVMEDLGSLNGLFGPDTPARATRVLIRPGAQVRVGHTTLRFRDAAEPVPVALRDVPDRAWRLPAATRWLATPWGRLLVAAAAIGAMTFYVWLGSYERSSGTSAFEVAFTMALIVSIWAGIWAIASRIVVHRFHFLEHAMVASGVVLATLAYVVLEQWGSFLFPDNGISDPAEVIFGLALFGGWIAGHLAFSSTMTRRRRWRIGLLTGCILFAVGGLIEFAKRDSFSDVPEFSGVIKPFPARWVPAGTVEGFGRVADGLKEQVDALAAREQ
jgi:pSer/pThr/pTyr-binding forkhead associated (FHA) protein